MEIIALVDSPVNFCFFRWERAFAPSTCDGKRQFQSKIHSCIQGLPLIHLPHKHSSNNADSQNFQSSTSRRKKCRKNRTRREGKSWSHFQDKRARCARRCHSRPFSHVFLKSRLQRHRTKINSTDDPFIQLRCEWSAQLTLIHHSPLAIKTRASTGGLVLHGVDLRSSYPATEKAREFTS